jgi:aminotransferase in exopolysaccharide biosynthesis
MFEEIVAFIKQRFGNPSFIPLHEPRFTGKEKEYLIDCIDSSYVSSVGRYVDEFEKMMREYTGAKYSVATVNGTAALHMSLILAGVKAGDLVITQALSFIATSNAITYLNAEPLYVDVDKSTLGLSPDALEDYLKEHAVVRGDECFHKDSNRRIAACVPMHTFGFPCRIDIIAEVCSKYNIPLVEDAAESIGSSYRGKQTGTFGMLGAFSFNGNKTITCGGGGVIVTDNEAIAKRGKHLTTQAKVPHRWEYVHDEIGYNYRLPNLNAALACAQMEQLDKFIDQKRKLAAEYKGFFASKDVQFVEEPEGSRSNYWLAAILLNSREERDKFLGYSNDNGVMTRPAWTLMHKLEMFRNSLRGELVNSEYIEDRLVNIPSSVAP